MTDMYVKIILGIISIISALISAYLVPYLNSKKHSEEFAMLNDFIIDMVRAANQLFTPEEWKEKKQYVLNLVTKYVNDKTSIGFTEDQIDAIIEGIVREVKVNDGIQNITSNSNTVN